MKARATAAIVFFAAATAAAGDPSPEGRAIVQLDRGENETAIAILKRGLEANPHSKTLYWLLVEAYLADQNEHWALRTLHTIRSIDPEDCEAELVIAHLSLLWGDVEEAVSLAAEARCDASTASAARKDLLLAQAAFAKGRSDEGVRLLRRAARAAVIYSADREALRAMTATRDPGAVVPFQGDVDMYHGWTSNAAAGSPTDRSTRTDAAGPLLKLDTRLRFTAPTGRWVRPVTEGGAVLQVFPALDVFDESTAYLSGKTGMLIGDDAPRALLLFDADALAVFGKDRYSEAPLWFYNGYRGEVEVQLPFNLLLFGGAGRRIFREMGRTRTELDGGLGVHVSASSHVSLLLAATARGHDAQNGAYDLRGATALVSSDIRLKRDITVRGGALVSVDDYPVSHGYFDAASPDVHRLDTLLKLSLHVLSPSFHHLRASLGYEFADRFSTTDAYSYVDHRILLRFSYRFSADPFLPRRARNARPIRIFEDRTEDDLDQRIQDLIRQEDAARRSSSCVE